MSGKVDVDLAKRIVELIDGDAWQLADLLVEAFPADRWGDADRAGGNTALHDELRRYELLINREYGVNVTGPTLRQYRATALAWPSESRNSLASFTVHKRMRGVDRQAEMTKRLREARRENRALSEKLLSRLRADENPKPGRPFDERIRSTITAATRRELLGGIKTDRADWWMAQAVTDEARTIAVRELHALAAAIAGSTR